MRKKQNKKIGAGIIFALLCVALIVGLYLKPKRAVELNKTESAQVTNFDTYKEKNSKLDSHLYGNDITGGKKETPNATSSVSFAKSATFKMGDTEFKIQATDHTTVYDAMNNLMSQGDITFEGTQYPGLGFFVTQVGPLASGGGKNLMYYINGKEASLGVSSYVVKEGDIIEWKLK